MRTANFDDLSTRLLKKNTSSRKRDPRRPIFQSFSSSFVINPGPMPSAEKVLEHLCHDPDVVG